MEGRRRLDYLGVEVDALIFGDRDFIELSKNAVRVTKMKSVALF